MLYTCLEDVSLFYKRHWLDHRLYLLAVNATYTEMNAHWITELLTNSFTHNKKKSSTKISIRLFPDCLNEFPLHLQISSNGYITFGSGYSWFNPWPNYAFNGPKMIAPYWSDIYLPADTTDSHIWYRESTTSRDLKKVVLTLYIIK